MKTGILGGAFDPPHLEHINICLNAIKELGLDKVVLVPSGIQPHKNSSVSSNLRCDMIIAAIKSFYNLSVDDIELTYNKIGFASEILPLLQEKYGDIVYIVGGDSFMSMRNWHNPEIIFRSFPIAVIDRDGNRLDIMKEIKNIEDTYGARIKLLNYEASDISSTLVRAKLELNDNVSDLIPDRVMDIIRNNNLYNNMSSMVNKLKTMISPETYAHTKRTVYKALQYNQRLGLSYEKVFIAALLHDCAKGLPLQEAYRYQVPIDAIDTPVMHAFQGVAISEKEFGVEDSEILNAIRYHTTGKAKMTHLEMLIFVADMLEDNRNFSGVVELRYLVEENQLLGFMSCVEHQYNYLVAKKIKMYHLTEECYNYYIRRSSNDN